MVMWRPGNFLYFETMKRLAVASLFLSGCLSSPTRSHAQPASFADTVAAYFSEVKKVTANHRSLWNADLYAPILLVDPVSRTVYANQADSAGLLEKNGKIFTGLLPKTVNISNTSIHWNGVNWAMVMLPVPANKNNRVNLLAHELFHRAQNTLGFYPYNTDNNHLDKKEGRVFLRLELKALLQALDAGSASHLKEQIRNALAFRAWRRSLFPGADSTENALELNEGICEFTGMMMSGRRRDGVKAYFKKRFEFFISSPSYVRSFAYETVPVYGYLLSGLNRGWNRSVNGKTDLGQFFQREFGITLPADLAAHVKTAAQGYRGEEIIAEEQQREERISKQLAAYKTTLIDSPHVELPLQHMNMSFDYTQMVPLDNHGTVYPKIRITDDWGILEVEKASLISPGWNQVNVGYPASINGSRYSGDGWTLELNDGYILEKAGLNYVLRKK